ncbi:MAG TPA: signal peptidase I [Caulobacteraceae bacterium]
MESARSLGVALVVMLVLRTAVFQPFTIPSSSMEPTLVTGDYMIVSKFAYGWSRASFPFDPPLFSGRIFGRAPARGDVVVFRLPRDPRQTWVKRVIGVPGDHIQVLGGSVMVNGRVVPRTPLGFAQDHDAPARTVMQMRETQPDGRAYVTYGGRQGGEGDDTSVYVVPAKSYFMMGDNRDNSLDSRWPREVGVGFLPAENIMGKAEIVLASWRPGSALFKPWTWLRLDPARFFRPVR